MDSSRYHLSRPEHPAEAIEAAEANIDITHSPSDDGNPETEGTIRIALTRYS